MVTSAPLMSVVIPSPLDLSLYITETFLSIQGESTFTGLPTTFIRLSGCPLRCHWCDTTYSFSRGEGRTLEELLKEVHSNGVPNVCVTGGEPLTQKNVLPLLSELCDSGYQVSIETSGALSIAQVDPRVHRIVDMKCPGSGMVARNDYGNLELLTGLDQLKFVILDRVDYEWSKELCVKHQLFEQETEILFSPVSNKLEVQDLVGWILKDQLPVRLNLQMHKQIWPDTMMGV